MGLYWHQGSKKDTIKFGRPICMPQKFLGPICNPKMLKVGPKVFLALTPSVNRALKGVG